VPVRAAQTASSRANSGQLLLGLAQASYDSGFAAEG
jgi:hypothetical protein